MSSNIVTYRREQLYEEVWAEPVRTVAQRYGISDVALAKICRKLAVPRPGVGYWAKVAAGQAPKRTPLPKTPRDAPEEITRYRRDPEPSAIARALSAAREVDREVIEVATNLEQPHKLVAAAIRVLGRAKTDVDGLRRKPGRRCLDVTVSPATFDRAMLIIDAFLRALEKDGMRCEVTDVRRFDGRGRPVDTGDVPPNTTRVFVDEEWCVVRLWEKYSLVQPPLPKPPRGLVGDPLDSWVRWNRPIQRRVPNGILELSLTQGYSRATWKDGKRKRLEGFGSPGRTRTSDMVVNSHPLYRLSYRGTCGAYTEEGRRSNSRAATRA